MNSLLEKNAPGFLSTSQSESVDVNCSPGFWHVLRFACQRETLQERGLWAHSRGGPHPHFLATQH